MAKVKFSASRASKNLKQRLDRLSERKELEFEIGLFLVERVKLEARRGRPLNDNRKFPELKESTKAIRRNLARFNKTTQAFDPDFSNLSLTGQLQEAITFVKLGGGLFVLFVDDENRTPYRLASGQSDEVRSNADVDQDLRDGVGIENRKFVLFTVKGLKSEKKISRRIKQIYLRFLRRELRGA